MPWPARRRARGSLEPVGIWPMAKQPATVSSLSAMARMPPRGVAGIGPSAESGW